VISTSRSPTAPTVTASSDSFVPFQVCTTERSPCRLTADSGTVTTSSAVATTIPSNAWEPGGRAIAGSSTVTVTG